MNIEEFENEIEKILDENHERQMHWMKLFAKAHNEGNDNIASLCMKEVKLLEARDKGVYQVEELVRKMLNNK